MISFVLYFNDCVSYCALFQPKKSRRSAQVKVVQDELLVPMPVAQIMSEPVVSQANVGSLATSRKHHRKRSHDGMIDAHMYIISYH